MQCIVILNELLLASLFNRVKMAEMYGELMEFNDRLHKQLNTKDAIIIRLGQTITMAKIEVSLVICSYATHVTHGLPPDASSC